MIVVPTIYKIYTNHNNNLERVIKEEFLYQAKICYKENNCESKILLKDLYENDKDRLADYTKILYNQARLIEGLTVENPTELTNLICDLMSK